jgi:translation initiation factor IF-3
VLLIDEEKNIRKEMPTGKALEIAREKELDLVEVAPTVQPPVCKIIDYGKYLYRLAKQDRIQKAHQKKTELKGIRIGIKTEKHDLDFKAKRAQKFMEKGHKIKIDMFLRGREKAHQGLAREKLENFIQTIFELSPEEQETVFEQPLKKSPNGFNVIIKYKI